MAAITKTECLAISTEFTGVSDATWTTFLAMSLSRMNPAVWGTKLNQGQSLLTCHLLKSLGFGVASYDNTGKLTSGNTTPTDTSNDFDSTVYGRQFLALRREVSFASGGLLWVD